MNKIIMLLMISVFIGCNLQYDPNNPQNVTVSQATATPSPVDCYANDPYCTKVKGQIFYTTNELMTAPITNGQLNLRYSLSNFEVFLIGQGQAYSGISDMKGNFTFSGVEPGEYSLLARYVPPIGSDLFYDCVWTTETSGVTTNGQVAKSTSVCVVTDPIDPTPYKIGLYLDNISVTNNQVSQISLQNIQKFYMDSSGYISQTQTVTSDNSAPIQSWTGPTLNIGH